MVTSVDGTALLDPAVLADPYPFYARLRTEAPVWEVADTGVFTVNTFELVTEAAARVDNLSSNLRYLLYRDENDLPARFWLGDESDQVLAVADPPAHDIHRKTVFPDLVAKRMTSLEPEIRDLAHLCTAEALEQDTVEFMGAIGNIVPITMISRLIGFNGHDRDKLIGAAFDAGEMVGGTDTLDELTACMARMFKSAAWVTEDFRAAMRNPGDDLLGTLAHGVRDEVFTEFAAVGILSLLLSAGGESTSALIGNAVRMLAERPQLQDHLRARPDLVPPFIEEVLRLESPFRGHSRYAPTETELGGVAIPEGSVVLLLWSSANRDPSRFHRADDIDLERQSPRNHFAFGRGLHFCVGAALARLEARVVINLLLERTSRIELVPDDTPRWVNSLFVRRHEHLPLRLAVK